MLHFHMHVICSRLCSVPFLIYIFLCQLNSVLISIMLQRILLNYGQVPYFTLQNREDILGFVLASELFKCTWNRLIISILPSPCQIPCKTHRIEILIEHTLNLQVNLKRTDTFITFLFVPK